MRTRRIALFPSFVWVAVMASSCGDEKLRPFAPIEDAHHDEVHEDRGARRDLLQGDDGPLSGPDVFPFPDIPLALALDLAGPDRNDLAEGRADRIADIFLPVQEACGDGADNDGAIDCQDGDCEGQSCAINGFICQNSGCVCYSGLEEKQNWALVIVSASVECASKLAHSMMPVPPGPNDDQGPKLRRWPG